MRHFHSYGPVSCKLHFCVERNDLIKQCTEQLVGDLQEGGHYFTIWSQRQNGKTWLMRQVKKRIEAQYGNRFIFTALSMQGLIMSDDDPDEVFFKHTPFLFQNASIYDVPEPVSWNDWNNLFSKKQGLFDRPTLLFIDEFDSLPVRIIDQLVTLFRNMYLNRDEFMIHGMALIGVSAVLGVGSDRGSPFNIQRALHVPNFTYKEVDDLFEQYQEESGQEILPEVVEAVYESTRGQPGLVCWFGELLTEKYNPGQDKRIDADDWKLVFHKASFVEWNNTVLNLITKVRKGFRREVLELFSRSDIKFTLDAQWCAYLYLNGVIDTETHTTETGELIEICRFSSPFIQKRLFNALTYDLMGDRLPILALEPLDDLADVFNKDELDLPALLQRYKDYLARRKARGLNPWQEQPRRADLHLTEAVGHFHLYSWLQSAVQRQCIISPEFPTGNGKVDIFLKCGLKSGIIEIKSFIDAAQIKEAKKQAAGYARQTGHDSVTIALFVPLEDEEILSKISGKNVIENVNVIVCAIGWV